MNLIFFPGIGRQGETQAVYKCEVADEPVVVMKFQPMKPGNSVEDKTETTTGTSAVGLMQAKSGIKMRRGEVDTEAL